MTGEEAGRRSGGRRAQGAETIVVLIFIVAMFFALIVALAFLKFKVNFAITEVSAQEDQLPTMQALSYSTVGRLIRTPVLFYNLASIASVTGQDVFIFSAESGSVSIQDILNQKLETYSAGQLALFYPKCFEYNLNDEMRGPLWTKFLAAGTIQADSCQEYGASQADKGQETFAKKNYIYFFPLPPLSDGTARLSEQFIRVFALRDKPRIMAPSGGVERPDCNANGAAASLPEDCCSGRMAGGVCMP